MAARGGWWLGDGWKAVAGQLARKGRSLEGRWLGGWIWCSGPSVLGFNFQGLGGLGALCFRGLGFDSSLSGFVGLLGLM